MAMFDGLYMGGRKPPAVFLLIIAALVSLAGAEGGPGTGVRVGILEAEMFMYDVSAGGVLEYRDDWSKQASRQASISAALMLMKAGYNPIILPDLGRSRPLFRLKTKMRYHGTAFQSEFFSAAGYGGDPPNFSVGPLDSLCDYFGVEGFVYTYGYEEKFSPERRRILSSSTGAVPPERVFAASLLVERSGAVLWYDQTMPMPGAPRESESEGVHVPSLMAQAKGMEQRFWYQGLLWDDRDLEEHLDAILVRLATPEERKRYNLRVRILRSSAFDAFAAPDGAIYVCIGLLSRAASEAQIAAFLGHELAHVVFDHTEKSLRIIKEHARAEALALLPDTMPKAAAKRDSNKKFTPMTMSKAKPKRTLATASSPNPNASRRPGSGYSSDMMFWSMTGALRAAVDGRRQEFEAEADSLARARMADAGYTPPENFRQFIKDMTATENFTAVPTGDAGRKPVNAGLRTVNARLRSVVLSDAVTSYSAGLHDWTEVQTDRLLSIDECDPSALLIRGDMERMLAPRSVAWAEWYEKALACDPYDTVALRAAGYAYFALGDKEKAREYLGKYCELVPDAQDIKMAREALSQCE